MSFDDLLNKRAIEKVEITPSEIRDRLAIARRDIQTAEGVAGTNLDWAYVIAYNGILQASTAYMNSLGYRPRGEGHHYSTFRFMEEALPENQAMIRRVQKLRRKRNMTVYDQTGLVGEKEAHEVIEFAARYYRDIERRLPKEVTGDEEESR